MIKSLLTVYVACWLFVVALAFSNTKAQAEGGTVAIAADRDRLELEFAKHWNTYLLAKHGCPPLTTVGMRVGPEDCHAAQGEVLYGELDKARKLAAKVFELEPR